MAGQLEIPLDPETCAECEGTGDCSHCGGIDRRRYEGKNACAWCADGRCTWCEGKGIVGWDRFR